MNFPVDIIQQIIARAMQAYESIKRDPVAFLKNLLNAVKQGFQQFFGNIGTHLLNGLTGWLFAELQQAGVKPPQDLSFRSILSFVLDVLGVTVEKIWQKTGRTSAHRTRESRSYSRYARTFNRYLDVHPRCYARWTWRNLATHPRTLGEPLGYGFRASQELGHNANRE